MPQEAVVPGAKETAGLWGHGLSGKQTQWGGRQLLCKQTQEEGVFVLVYKEERLIIPYSQFSAQRTNQVLL